MPTNKTTPNTNNVIVNTVDGNDELTFDIDAGEVLCIAQLPEIIQVSKSGNTVDITLSQYDGNEVLLAYWNCDGSTYGLSTGNVIPLTAGVGQIAMPDVYVKLILKLYDAAGEILLDEVVLGENDTAGPGNIATWHLDEGSGTIAYDSTRDPNNGILVGDTPPQWTAGLLGDGGIQLICGYNSYQGQYGSVFLGDSYWNGMGNYFPYKNSITLEMYVKWDYRASGPNPGDSNDLGYLWDDPTTRIRGYIDDTNPAEKKCRLDCGAFVYTYPYWFEASTPYEFSLTADEWTHIAFTRDWNSENPNSTTVKIFVDGELAATNVIGTGSNYVSGPIYIGSSGSGKTCWGGEVDEVKFSDISINP